MHGAAETGKEAGEDAEKFGGLAVAAGEEQDGGEGGENHLGQGEQGHDGGFAGLAAAVEENALVVGFEHLELPGVGLEAEVTHETDGVAGVGWHGDVGG